MRIGPFYVILFFLHFSVNKLKEEHDVQISIPNESSRSDEIRLEGRKENVEAVKEAIAEIVSKQVIHIFRAIFLIMFLLKFYFRRRRS